MHRRFSRTRSTGTVVPSPRKHPTRAAKKEPESHQQHRRQHDRLVALLHRRQGLLVLGRFKRAHGPQPNRKIPLVQERQPTAVLMLHSHFLGRDLAPVLAYRLGSGLISDCIDLEWSDAVLAKLVLRSWIDTGRMREAASDPMLLATDLAEVLSPEQLEEMLPPDALTVESGQLARQGKLHSENGRLSFSMPLLQRVPAQLSPQRRARLDTLVDQLQCQTRLVRLVRRERSKDEASIVAEVDLSGAPPMRRSPPKFDWTRTPTVYPPSTRRDAVPIPALKPKAMVPVPAPTQPSATLPPSALSMAAKTWRRPT